MSQAFAAGIPHLVTPFNLDHPLNVEQPRRLGAGDSIRVKDYQAGRVAAKLQKLLGSPTVAENCRRLKEKIAQADAIGDVCRPIEAALPAQPGSSTPAASQSL